jgi:hypothetical protein
MLFAGNIIGYDMYNKVAYSSVGPRVRFCSVGSSRIPIHFYERGANANTYWSGHGKLLICYWSLAVDFRINAVHVTPVSERRLSENEQKHKVHLTVTEFKYLISLDSVDMC